jgi:hypothetical protein
VSQQVWHDKDPSLLKGPDNQFWVCNLRYPDGGDARLTAAHLID